MKISKERIFTLSWRRWLLVVVGIVIVVGLVGAGWFIHLLGPKDTVSYPPTVLVTIPEHSSRAEVANLLDKSGVIQSGPAFLLYLRLTGADVLPGPYRFSANQSAFGIGKMLLAGQLATADITLPEGWRATDIEEYLVTTKKLTQFKGFATATAQYEGYLFPDTYNIRVDETTPQLIALLRQNFQKKTASLGTLTTQTVILASIVEREAGANDDRALIAGVYTHRLEIGMKLQADPTVQYARNSWGSITGADITATISPYNTYLNTGLPPGPIANPGLASLKAALHPTKTNYLYFFSAHGKTYYASTLAEQEANITKYR